MKIEPVEIYKVTSPSGNMYIGISNNSDHRYNQHKSSENSALYPVIKKYGKEKLIHRVICVALNRKFAEELEVYFITKYNSFRNGYNRTRGGEGCSKGKKLIEKEVLEIVKCLDDEVLSLRQIAEIFGVKEGTVRSINSGKTWKHITKRDNDGYRTGYKVNGSEQGSSMLTESDVVKIKNKIINKHSLVSIAREFNVKPITIGQIKAERNWKHVKVEGFSFVSPDKKCSNKLTMSDAVNIRTLKNNGMKINEIAKMYNISRTSISKVINYKTFK